MSDHKYNTFTCSRCGKRFRMLADEEPECPRCLHDDPELEDEDLDENNEFIVGDIGDGTER